jgi:hypothetical protein
MTTRLLAIVVAAACAVSGTAEATTNLKPFDPVALQRVVETAAKELLLPGAMVLLRTPQGDFAFGSGATELGGTSPPRADTHFRAGSNTNVGRLDRGEAGLEHRCRSQVAACGGWRLCRVHERAAPARFMLGSGKPQQAMGRVFDAYGQMDHARTLSVRVVDTMVRERSNAIDVHVEDSGKWSGSG